MEARYRERVIHELKEMEVEGMERVPSPEAVNVEEELDLSLFDNLEWVASLGMGASEAL